MPASPRTAPPAEAGGPRLCTAPASSARAGLPRPGRAGLAALVAAGLLWLAGTAAARSSATWYYPLVDVYSTAVRFIRIDRGCAITDRDPQAAYLMFECKDGSKVRRGALELFRSGEAVRAQLTLADEPSYMEAHFLDQLGQKLKDERGPSVPPPP